MNDHIRIFTAGDTARILDLPRRRVLFLAEAGVVRPSVESEGRGKRRRYSRHDLLMMSVTSLLDKFGVKPSLMKIIIDELVELDGDATVALWWQKGKLKHMAITEEERILSAMAPLEKGVVLMVSLAHIGGTLDYKIEETFRRR